MRTGLLVLLLVCLALACSASENANHSIRCDSNTLCPSQQVCYREFCIPDDTLPRFDVDAAVVVGEPVAPDAGQSDAAPVDVPMSPLDASTADDAALISAEDAGPVVSTPPVTPPVTPPDADVPTTPVVPPTTEPADAGSRVSDAGRVNSSALLICLPSCSNRSSACWFCLNGILANNPGICSPENRADPVSGGLCDFLCTTAACRGER